MIFFAFGKKYGVFVRKRPGFSRAFFVVAKAVYPIIDNLCMPAQHLDGDTSREPGMHVSLTPELEAHIKAKVESGLYNNASEVIREALRFVDTHEDWIHEIKLAHLREQLKVATDELDRGKGIVIESKSALDVMFDEIKA